MWRENHFGKGGEGEKEKVWIGTASELLRDMLNMETLKEIAGKQVRNSQAMGSFLENMIIRRSPIVIHAPKTATRSQEYKITRPGKRFDSNGNPVPDTPDAEVDANEMEAAWAEHDKAKGDSEKTVA